MTEPKIGNLCRLINEGITNEEDGKNWLFLITRVYAGGYEAIVVFSSIDDNQLPSPLKLFSYKGSRFSVYFNYLNKPEYFGSDFDPCYEGDLEIVS